MSSVLSKKIELEALSEGRMETILLGDSLEVLKTLPDESVHCVVSSPPYFRQRSYLPETSTDKIKELGQESELDCLAWARQYPLCGECYVCKLTELFLEIKRILRKDGVFFLNLGDGYAANRTYQVPSTKGGKKHSESQSFAGKGSKVPNGLKPKDLHMVPARVALSLQANGFYLRQDCIWVKKNSLPEAVKDRFVRNNEYVYLFSKSPKYFFDAEAVKVPVFNKKGVFEGKVNRRGVFNLTTACYKGAHTAVFPYALVEPLILAGCPEKICASCGTPYVRKEKVVGTQLTEQMRKCGANAEGTYTGQSTKEYKTAKAQNASETKRRILESMSKVKEFVLEKVCSCASTETKPGVVLDPFAGSGTTLWVAKCLGRDSIGIELNPEYIPLIQERLQQPRPEKKKEKTPRKKNTVSIHQPSLFDIE